MKYIDADKLIAEIERLKNKYPSWQLKLAMDDLYDFITSLQQERPEVKLEKELDQWRHKHFKGKRDDDYNGEYLERESQLDLARHFYELGQQNRSKISNNSLKELRKEVIKFNQDHFDELHSDMDTIDIVHIVAGHFFELGKIARTEE